jgi:hypothetical protein
MHANPKAAAAAKPKAAAAKPKAAAAAAKPNAAAAVEEEIKQLYTTIDFANASIITEGRLTKYKETVFNGGPYYSASTSHYIYDNIKELYPGYNFEKNTDRAFINAIISPPETDTEGLQIPILHILTNPTSEIFVFDDEQEKWTINRANLIQQLVTTIDALYNQALPLQEIYSNPNYLAKLKTKLEYVYDQINKAITAMNDPPVVSATFSATATVAPADNTALADYQNNVTPSLAGVMKALLPTTHTLTKIDTRGLAERQEPNTQIKQFQNILDRIPRCYLCGDELGKKRIVEHKDNIIYGLCFFGISQSLLLSKRGNDVMKTTYSEIGKMVKLFEYAYACDNCNAKKTDHNMFHYKGNDIVVNLYQYVLDQEKAGKKMARAGILHFQLMADMKNLTLDNIGARLIKRAIKANIKLFETNPVPKYLLHSAFSILKLFVNVSRPLIVLLYQEIKIQEYERISFKKVMNISDENSLANMKTVVFNSSAKQPKAGTSNLPPVATSSTLVSVSSTPAAVTKPNVLHSMVTDQIVAEHEDAYTVADSIDDGVSTAATQGNSAPHVFVEGTAATQDDDVSTVATQDDDVSTAATQGNSVPHVFDTVGIAYEYKKQSLCNIYGYEAISMIIPYELEHEVPKDILSCFPQYDLPQEEDTDNYDDTLTSIPFSASQDSNSISNDNNQVVSMNTGTSLKRRAPTGNLAAAPSKKPAVGISDANNISVNGTYGSNMGGGRKKTRGKHSGMKRCKRTIRNKKIDK